MKPAKFAGLGRNAVAALVAACMLGVAGVQAATPATMSFQGYLTSAGGAPVNGSQPMTFRLYNVASGGAPLWSETQPTVAVTGGIYNVSLGSVTPIALPFDVPYFLGIAVGSDAEMTPRLALATVGYAFRAAQVDLVVTSSLADGSVTAAKLAPSGCGIGQVLQYNGAAWTCVTISSASGTVTSVATGAGLTGGPITGAGTVAIAAGGVGPTELGSNAVTTVKIADANVTTAKVADANVTTAKIADANVTKAKLAAPGAAAGQMLTTDGASLTWSTPPLTQTVVNPLGNTITAVDSAAQVGGYMAITLGADGVPVISYLTTAGMKVAKCANAACTGTATLTILDNANPTGYGTSVTVGLDGLPVIAYLDVLNSDLKVAKCANAACTGAATITTVDSTGLVGNYPSITLGADGLPVMSYYDTTIGQLKVAKCANAACTGAATITAVDPTGGQYNSITLGVDGLPIISYWGFALGDLKVAKCVNAACTGAATITTVDGGPANVGHYSSIALGADGLPVISYYDATNLDLKVAKCTNAACTGVATITTVDSAGDVGQHTSITIGADGLPVVSYWDLTNNDLKVARCANAACTGTANIVAVDTTGNVGQYTSITLGADGMPLIAYWGASTSDLKVVKCSSPTCMPFVRRR